LMEKTWRAVGAMSDAEIRQRQGLCGKEQQELTGFVLAYTSELPPEALGLALYAHFVVIEAFRRTGARFRKLKPTTIASEPAVMQYVIDALTEENEDDTVALTADDCWRIFQVLKT